MSYYIICLIALIIGIYLIKRFVSCLIRSIITIVLLALFIYIYFMYIQ